MSRGDGVVVADGDGQAFELREIHCPTCGPGADVAIVGLRGGEHHRYGLGVTTRIMRCRSCGLLYPNPFPFPRSPQELYGDPEKYFVGHDTEAKIEGNRAIARGIKRLTRSERPSILDVGSGRGEFLVAAREEGLACVGLEFSQAMIEFARGQSDVTLVDQSIERHAATGARYDAVVLNAVIEHVYDPDSMVASAARLVRPGGLLYVDTPNEPHLMSTVGNALNRLRGRPGVYNLSPTWPPYHVFGFNRQAITRLLDKHGFVVLDVVLWARPSVPARGAWGDRLAAFGARQLVRVGNYTGRAANMVVWARRTR